MEKSEFLKKRITFIGITLVVIVGLILGFVSFGEDGSTKAFEKFIKNFKDRKFEESFKYVAESENKNLLGSYIQNDITNLSEEISNKIFEFTYNVVETVEEGNNSKIRVKFNYYNLMDGYQSALDEFLTRALDFENLDNLYNKENIDNILITHIKKLKLEEKELEIDLIKDKDWKIILDEEFLEILTGNSIKLITILKENSIEK